MVLEPGLEPEREHPALGLGPDEVRPGAATCLGNRGLGLAPRDFREDVPGRRALLVSHVVEGARGARAQGVRSASIMRDLRASLSRVWAYIESFTAG